jgi:GT2 family glycosyltransferase
MDVNEQPASELGVALEDDLRNYRRALVQQAYRGFLDRDADEEEIGFHVGHLERAMPLEQLILSIATGPEAQAVRDRRLSGWRPVSQPAQPILHQDERLTIRADDVLEAIAHVFALGGGTLTSDDVMAGFSAVRSGEDLASVIKAVEFPVPAPASMTEDRFSVEQVVRNLYRDVLKRTASDAEVNLWYNEVTNSGALSTIVLAIQNSTEAEIIRSSGSPSDVPAGLLVQLAFEIILGRGASAPEVDLFRTRIERDGLSMSELVMSFFNDQVSRRLNAPKVMNNPDQAYLYGSRGVVDSSEWDTQPGQRAKDANGILSSGSVFAMKRDTECAVSIITSLFKGGDYIEAFLENITSQTIFRDHCELIIVDASSPEGEGEVIARFQETHPNIVYRRMDSRIGIYEAWNIGIEMAKGRYLTNANLDDCRRADSLEIQATILDSLPFVDVAYQDVLYSFEPNISFDKIEAHGLKTNLPVISRYNLSEFNSPHNGPMWRKSLHEDVGLFNQNYRSAADFDFWLRCRLKGKRFYKSNEAHVAYYVNPNGLSTREDTVGVVEANAISKTLYRQIVSPLVVMGDAEFLQEVREVAPIAIESGRRYDILQTALREIGSADRARTTGRGK